LPDRGSNLDRREFLKRALFISAGAALAGCGSGTKRKPAASLRQPPPHTPGGTSVIAVSAPIGPSCSHQEALSITLDALGGMKAFVPRGSKVVIKPNAAWTRTPAQAANTSPELVEAIVRLCQKAGAGSVTIVEHPIDTPPYLPVQLSGIEEVARRTGAELDIVHRERDFQEFVLPKGKLLTTELVAKPILDAEVLINLPTAKVHSNTLLTLSLKNLMGMILQRQAWHNSPSLDQCIADFATALRPTLNILDATRLLMTNGPKGPGEVKKVGRIVAGVDPVAVDSYACAWFGHTPEQIGHIALSAQAGVGEMNLNKIKVVQA